jgi:hypothetical protein
MISHGEPDSRVPYIKQHMTLSNEPVYIDIKVITLRKLMSYNITIMFNYDWFLSQTWFKRGYGLHRSEVVGLCGRKQDSFHVHLYEEHA